jgi:uncharacterized protein YjeT (DUF2065 family)
MSIAWPDFAAALGLLLVAEGILPFLSPAGLRRAYERLVSLDDAALRLAGATSMVAGLVVLWLVRG